jgi:hypothetical protein
MSDLAFNVGLIHSCALLVSKEIKQGSMKQDMPVLIQFGNSILYKATNGRN